MTLGSNITSIIIPAISNSRNRWSLSEFSIDGNTSNLIRLLNAGTTTTFIPPDYLECVAPKSFIPQTVLEIYAPVNALLGVQKRVFSSRGANINGRYYKHADCSMTCTHEITTDVAISTAFLGGFKSEPITWTFPFAFSVAEVPIIEITPVGSGALGAIVETVTNTGCTIALTAVTTQALSSRKFQIKATANFIRM